MSVWSGPRNISTALMYSFAQRRDTRVVDEPFYGHYLRVTGAPHPGAAAVMAAMSCDSEAILRDVVLAPCDRPVLFLKNMAHHLEGIPRQFLNRTINVMLTRDPAEMLPSLDAVLAAPQLADTGYVMLYELLQAELMAGREPVVLEARELLLNPARILALLCEKLELPFDPAMLQWPAGPRPEDGVWARFWYANVHRSTGFAAYRPRSADFPAHLQRLLADCRPYYDAVADYAIRA